MVQNTEVISALLNGLIGIIGAVIGSLASLLFASVVERRRERRDNVMALYREYHTMQMSIDRNSVATLFQNKPPDVTYNQLREAFEKKREATAHNVTREEWEALVRLFNFFTQLNVYRVNGYLDNKLAKRVLAGYFCGWYHNRIKRLLDISEPERASDALFYRRKHMRELAEWLADVCAAHDAS
jgi:gas vesicle protein